jgi:hypothetical protein
MRPLAEIEADIARLAKEREEAMQPFEAVAAALWVVYRQLGSRVTWEAKDFHNASYLCAEDRDRWRVVAREAMRLGACAKEVKP